MHFSVAVIGLMPDHQLEPFYEGLQTEFVEECANTREDVFEFLKACLNKEDFKEAKRELKGCIDLKSVVEKFLYSTYNSETDSFGYWCNPDARYDWYSVGGRFRGHFVAKNPDDAYLGPPGVGNNDPIGNADCLEIKNIDWEKTREVRNAEGEKWWKIFLRMNPNSETTKKEYLKNWKNIATHSLLDEEGNWYDSDEFDGTNDEWEEFWMSKIMEAHPGTIVSVYDCHI